MTKVRYGKKEDIELINIGFFYNAWLIMGKKNKKLIFKFLNIYNKRVKEINIYKKDEKGKLINYTKVPGICYYDVPSQKLIIEYYKDDPNKTYEDIIVKHRVVHENSHAFADLLPLMYGQNKQGIVKDSVIYRNEMGLIATLDYHTKDYIEHHYYNKFFNETMMDIMAALAIKFYVKKEKFYNIWDIEPEYLKITSSFYEKFIPLTFLAIAAFSNDVVDYYQLLKKGYGICNLKINKDLILNDFLYGIYYDPQHIERVFNKINGKVTYKILCEELDYLYIAYKEQHIWRKDKLIFAIRIIDLYRLKKIQYYLENNIVSRDKLIKIMLNFEKVLIYVKDYYGITEEEMGDNR